MRYSTTGETLALVGGAPGGEVVALDRGLEGAGLMHRSLADVAPGGAFEAACYLALAPDLESARVYEALGRAYAP